MSALRLRMADVKASRIPEVLGICATDDRLADYTNESQERMLHRGNWVGTQAQHIIRTINGKITWPRHVLVPNGVSLCGCNLDIRNEWYEFLGNGPGLQDETCGYRQVIDRGISVAFDDIDEEGMGDKKIRVYCDLSVDVGKVVTLQGTDENGARVMTIVSGSWIDGEQITLAQSPGTLSTKKYTKLLGAIKDETIGWVRGYEVDSGTGLNTKALFVYDPTETLPTYRRSVISGYGQEDATNVQTITAWCNMRHIPVRRNHAVNDNDYLQITSLAALKEMCLSVKYAEDHDQARAEMHEGRCRRELEGELARYRGEGTILNVRAAPSDTWGAGGVVNVVGEPIYW
jgi:hypothetical protein